MAQSPVALHTKHTCTKILQPSGGGTQTFSLFGAPVNAPSPHRSSILVHAQNNATSVNSPFSSDPNAHPTPERRPSILASPLSNTFRSDINSPFSKEPVPERLRASSMANVPSTDNPFSNSDPIVAQQASWQPKANVPSEQSPFNPNPPSIAASQRPFTANHPSEHNPFSTSSGAPLPPTDVNHRPLAVNQMSKASPFLENGVAEEHTLSVKPLASPGGNLSMNIFAPPPEIIPSNRVPSGTWGYAAGSPFNRSPVTPTKTSHRAPPRVNLASDQNPFNQDAPPMMPPSPSSYTPKANIPAVDSPFSHTAAPFKAQNRDTANRQSIDSPFTGAPPPHLVITNASGSVRGPSTRVMQNPGGNQTFNLFDHQ